MQIRHLKKGILNGPTLHKTTPAAPPRLAVFSENNSEMTISFNSTRPITLTSTLVSVPVCTVLTWHCKSSFCPSCVSVCSVLLLEGTALYTWFVFIMQPQWFSVRWQQNVLGAFAKLKKKILLSSSFLSVRPPSWDDSAHTGRIFMKFDI